ncbi:MAG: hypothetical protein KGO03_14580 [Gemmatimonadota bacterium]|nr:hypothetical protein [Gemmatimonadota bacterium]
MTATIAPDVLKSSVRYLRHFTRRHRELIGALTFAASEGLTSRDDVDRAAQAWLRYGSHAHAAAGPDGSWTTVPGSLADRVDRATVAITERAAAADGLDWCVASDLSSIGRELRIEGMRRASEGRWPFVIEVLVSDPDGAPMIDEELIWAATAEEAAARGLDWHGRQMACEIVDEATARAVAATAVPPDPDERDGSWTMPGDRWPIAVRSVVDVQVAAPPTELGLPVVLHAVLS